MRTPILATLLAAGLSAGAHAETGLPALMKCAVSGHGGCSDGICVGSATRDPGIRMTINVARRTILLNGIAGHIDGDAPFAAPSARQILWHEQIIGLRQLSINAPDEKGVYVTLGNGSASLEFLCRAA
jgi:hypothetical protein